MTWSCTQSYCFQLFICWKWMNLNRRAMKDLWKSFKERSYAILSLPPDVAMVTETYWRVENWMIHWRWLKSCGKWAHSFLMNLLKWKTSATFRAGEMSAIYTLLVSRSSGRYSLTNHFHYLYPSIYSSICVHAWSVWKASQTTFFLVLNLSACSRWSRICTVGVPQLVHSVMQFSHTKCNSLCWSHYSQHSKLYFVCSITFESPSELLFKSSCELVYHEQQTDCVQRWEWVTQRTSRGHPHLLISKRQC